MKKVIFLIATTMLFTACHPLPSKEQKVGMANPASEFCVKQGGESKTRKDAQGNEYGMCHLKNGQVVEEWDYFRKNNP